MNSLLPVSSYQLGPLTISGTVLTSYCLTLGLAGMAWMAKSRLRIQARPWQASLEAVVLGMDQAIEGIAGRIHRDLLPFVGTLWIFLVLANLVGLIPGFHSPTRDLSATVALAMLVFFSVHWFGIRTVGLKKYLNHYISPNPILLPFHLVSEVSRTLALAVRLFGNMMSLEMTALLVLSVAGFLAPVPILMLHIIEALVQAYIFGTLALVYISGGIQAKNDRNEEDND